MTTIVVSFLAFLLLFVLVGVASTWKRQETTEDYLVASRSVAPWLAALSAVATNNSGFMFVGQIGYAYTSGIESIWMMVGWIVGDAVAWWVVHPRVRRQSETANASTLPALLGSHSRGDGQRRLIVILAGAITFLLLGVYAAAQLKAGSTALQALFGWDPRAGAILGAVIVVVYCFSGGIRASIWTDAAQSFVMIVAMMTLLVAAWADVGSPTALWENLKAQDPALVQLFPQNLKFGFTLYLVGMAFGGFGAVGQPHILVRFMAIRSVDEIHRARNVYFAWFVPFFIGSIAVGLYARGSMPDLVERLTATGLNEAAAAEQAMPELALKLLPDVLIGLTLAGLFSATMSTADSQILVCSGAVTQDLFPRWKSSYLVAKGATLVVTALSLGIALFAGESVFSLTLIAWSALAAGIGPALILRLLHVRLSELTMALMMVTGVAGVILWRHFELQGALFEVLPAMAASFFVALLMRPLDARQPAAPDSAREAAGETEAESIS